MNIGKLWDLSATQYPAVVTRPDVAKAASKLSEFLTNPGPDHLGYLHATRHLGIQYSANASDASDAGRLVAQVTVPAN